MNIFVGSLPFRIQESELKEIFEKYGEVTSVKIISDKFSGRSKGFAFVEMTDDAKAMEAIESLNGSEIDGRNIVVNKAEERKNDDRKSSYGSSQNKGGFNSGGSSRGGYNKGGYNKGGGNSNRRSSY